MNPKEFTILVVDDSPTTIEVLRRHLSAKGYNVYAATDVANAIRTLDSTPIDLVVTDKRMPDSDGLDLVRYVREHFDDMEVMMITGYATVDDAVTALKTGAEEYVPKPFTADELTSAVSRALRKLQARRTLRASQGIADDAPVGLVGQSGAMRNLYREIRKAAETKATVLITGESGTGKELVARAVHYSGSRAAAPFVPVNCGSIPEGLLESELFGHTKGAFTGASESRAGFFLTAHGGTIFLDEISETSANMQVRLLRVLETKEVQTLGSSRPRSVDVRVIAATNKNLRDLVKTGGFREDLFFRLNVLSVSVPPLRDRQEDVLLLTSHFLTKYTKQYRRPLLKFSDRALAVIEAYDWPGNVRELENVIQRLVVMSDHEVIDIHDLPSLMRSWRPPSAGLNRTLAEVELEHIRNVLASVGHNKTRASKMLGIDRKTLREKLKELHKEDHTNP